MPSLIPGFEYDIFISYRQKDNKGARWVTDFVTALRTELDATFKEDISIYFDENQHDGLLETHDVDESLREKLKCLIFIPVISRTYCDPNSFAWKHELVPFVKAASQDKFGLKMKLDNGNVSGRIIPIRIHELERKDHDLFESVAGIMRPIDFVFKTPGVNRPLVSIESHPNTNQNPINYRDQINKLANAIKDLIEVLVQTDRGAISPPTKAPIRKQRTATVSPKPLGIKRGIAVAVVLILLTIIGYAIRQLYFLENGHSEVLEKSIAVLPFQNLSGDKEQEYFSDGVTEEILNALAQIKNLKVVGRTSSFRFKGEAIDIKEVGEKLNVSTVLEGSVRRQGNHVKISARLLNVADGYQLWAEQFDATLNDMFKIQEEIAMTIQQKLKVTLLENEKIEIGLTENAEAYDAYLRGRYFWNTRELRESEKYFKKAIELDPSYAAAYAGLAECYVLFPYFHFGAPLDYIDKVNESAEKAIELDSTLVVPYAVIGFNCTSFLWNPAKAQVFFKKALLANPRYAPAHYWYGQYLCRYDSNDNLATAEMRKAVEIEPLSSIAFFNLGIALTFSKKYDEALKVLQVSAELNKKNEFSYLFTGHCYLELGQLDKSKQAYQQAADLSNEGAAAMLIYFSMKEGNSKRALEQFNELVLLSKTSYISPFSLALGASFLGRKDAAYEYIKQGVAVRDTWLTDSHRYPSPIAAGALLSDPRNKKILNDLNAGKLAKLE